MKKSLWDEMGLSGQRVVIMHQDDVGLTHAASQAYLELGLPSASIMTPGAWAPFIRHGDLGVHITLTSEWEYPRLRPLTDSPSLRDEQGYFWTTPLQLWMNAVIEDVRREMKAQIDTAYALGIDVTHIDTHQGSVMRPDIAEVYLSLAREYRVPAFIPDELPAEVPNYMRDALSSLYEKFDTPRFKWINGYSLLDVIPNESRIQWFIDTLSTLQPGVYHFNHHAMVDDGEGKRLPDWELRKMDYDALRHPEVKRLLHECTLLTYRNVRDAMRKYHGAC